MDRPIRTDELLAAANESSAHLNEVWEDDIFSHFDEDELLREWEDFDEEGFYGEGENDEEVPPNLADSYPELDVLDMVQCARFYFEACGFSPREIDGMKREELLARYEAVLQEDATEPEFA